MIHKKGSLESSYLGSDHLLADKIALDVYFIVITPVSFIFLSHAVLLSFTCEILQSNGKSDCMNLWRCADTIIFKNEMFNPSLIQELLITVDKGACLYVVP